MLSVIPAQHLSPFELAQLGHNLAAAVRNERRASQSNSAAGCPEPPRHDEEDEDQTDSIKTDEQIEAAIASEHVAS